MSCCKNTGVIHPLNLLSQSSNKHLNPLSRTKDNIWLKMYNEIQKKLEKEDDFRTREILNNPNNMRHMYTSPFHLINYLLSNIIHYSLRLFECRLRVFILQKCSGTYCMLVKICFFTALFF